MSGHPYPDVTKNVDALSPGRTRHVSGCVPTRLKQEAQRYLECGQLRFGFVEVTCEDVVRCPCGGRRTIKAVFSTHQAAEDKRRQSQQNG
jgi:hypothetical protein